MAGNANALPQWHVGRPDRWSGKTRNWTPIGNPRSVAVLYDPCAFSWEIVFSLTVEPGPEEPTEPWEYDECGLFPTGDEPEPLAPVARQLLRIRDGLTDVRN